MSTRQVVTCDRSNCGAGIDKMKSVYIHIEVEGTKKEGAQIFHRGGYDLCAKCTESFWGWLKNGKE